MEKNDYAVGNQQIRVSGTSPLSFDFAVGTTLEVREFAPSPVSRPTLGGRFKTNAFLLFKDRTKVGRLSQASLGKIGDPVPKTCTVVAVNKARKELFVAFQGTRMKLTKTIGHRGRGHG